MALTNDFISSKKICMKTKFYKAIKSNRKKLKEDGYHPSTIHTWEYAINIPEYKTALKLAELLDLDIQDIPYRKITYNQP